jgi:hypothetical protein
MIQGEKTGSEVSHVCQPKLCAARVHEDVLLRERERRMEECSDSMRETASHRACKGNMKGTRPDEEMLGTGGESEDCE